MQQIRKYLDIVMRRKTLILSCILISGAIGLIIYLLQPKIYQSATLLSYQQQKVNPAKMAPDLEAQIRDIVSTLSQIVTSRTSLEQIITDVGLYKSARQNFPMEDVVEMMREDIEVLPSKTGDTFIISFKGNQPNQVARVANTIAAKFIEENLKYREERASETSAYTEDELEMAKVMLDRKETVMRDYKLKYYNEMPAQRDANMNRLNSLQEQYQNRQTSIQDLGRTRILLQDQIAARKQMIEENLGLRRALLGTDTQMMPVVETDAQKLRLFKLTLDKLQTKYTENHPEVKLLKKKIADLEKGNVPTALKEKKSAENSLNADDEQFDKVLFELKLEVKQIGLSIERLNKEKDELKQHIEQYEKWASAAPVREAEWSALTREYGELKRHYDFLVAQNLQARSALNLERKQKGSQFKIEDPARIPEKPISPNFLQIFGLALLVGGGLGGGIALGLELLDSSFRDPTELEKAFGIEVICSVPQLSLPREKTRARVMVTTGWMLFVMGSSTIAGAFVYFYKNGQIVF